MSKINTVTGTISSDQMGITLMHEHMALGYPGWKNDSLSKNLSIEDLVIICSDKVRDASEHGVKTIVDATPPDLGRNVDLDRRVSNETGVNIICVTGLYYDGEGETSYWKFRSQIMDVCSEMYDHFMRELTIGIDDTGIKAGAIKVATSQGVITSYESSVLKAAAKAQKETNVPILTHTQCGTMGVEQATLLISEGVDPSKIVIGHMCGSANLEYHLSVLDKGVNIGFDRWGLEFHALDKMRIATILGLLGIGYEDRIVLSHDYIPIVLGRDMIIPDFVQELMRSWSYSHIFESIIPRLKKLGVLSEQIEQMTTVNPMEIFNGV